MEDHERSSHPGSRPSVHIDPISGYGEAIEQYQARNSVPIHDSPSITSANRSAQPDRATDNEYVEHIIPSAEDLDDATTKDNKDLEAGEPNPKDSSSKPNPMLVTWKGPDDPENPKNWKLSKKWLAAVTVSSFTFISPVSSSMVAPAISKISKEFHVESEIESELMLSAFVLAYAVGPLFLGPLSEIYGRVLVLQLANLIYLVFNIACGVCQSKGQMIAFRFLSGLGGSAPLAIGGGVLGDCFRPEERGKAVAVYSLAPLLGPAIAPVAGGFITENISWRWIFYVTSIADAVIQLAGLLFLRETFAPVLLKRKAELLRKETGNPDYQAEAERSGNKTLSQLLRVSLIRPFKLLGTQPIVIIFALYMAYVYGLMYLLLSTFSTLWTSPDYYNEKLDIGCLNYIALGIGYFSGSQCCAYVNDRIYRILKKKNNGVGKPEFRTPLLLFSAIATPVGLFIYGWTAQERTFWIGPDIGVCLFAMGSIMALQCTQTYIIDAYTTYAASALAAVACLRSIAGFSFPLFAPYMYNALHYGWGNSLLAFVSIGIGFPAPFVLWKYGERLRMKSNYAVG
ncbi:synaptic vesicle transporter [Aspergillus ellipticus CBS 707.79]|uniref:Synaptic vesicle transporter n=1 Tax=Aspergillus ellipticus CBS 707.79 TaxID=1448320 RepID=A0A319D6T8_9EURO|nr:synaptic vesicle transporter [Aspergillus ellipticus CBS 707.79]